MNILYYSVHQILEFDEVNLFKDLGHNVFVLGINSPSGAIQNFRPPIKFNEQEIFLYDEFARMGGVFRGGGYELINIPKEFMGYIDIVVVMHDVGFIKHFWKTFSGRPVVWRTIGQGVDFFEKEMQPYKESGLSIVRYSPVELNIENSLGQDAVIRFGKPADVYSGWVGDVAQVLTFSNSYRQRYPQDFDDYLEIVKDVPSVLGGGGNDGVKGSASLVTWESQIALLRDSRVYLYASGLYIPYTLNFMEAWIIGIPIVLYAPDRKGRYFEIDQLIVDGETGFVCRDIATAKERVKQLLDDRELASRIGAAGRAAALNYFGNEVIGDQWQNLLRKIKGAEKNATPAVSEHTIRAIYRVVLGREPESSGVDNFMKRNSVDDVLYEIINSEEARMKRDGV